MRTQYLHGTVYDNTYAARVTSATSEGVHIFTATGRKKTCNGDHRTIKKGASTDPKKDFEVINFILGHFVNFLEEIYQEKVLDVSSPLTLSSTYLLIFPISDLDGLISLQDILYGKLSLWSLMVMYPSLSCMRSMRSSIDNFVAIFFCVIIYVVYLLFVRFLYVLVIFSDRSLLYSSLSILYMFLDLSAAIKTLLLFLISFISLFSFVWKLLLIFLNSTFLIINIKSFSKLQSVYYWKTFSR